MYVPSNRAVYQPCIIQALGHDPFLELPIPENLPRLEPILYGRWKMHCALTCNCVCAPYRAIVFKNSQHFDFFAGFCGCLLAIDWFATTAPFLYLAISFLLVTNSVRGKRKAELLPVIINEVWTHNLKRQSKPGVGSRPVTMAITVKTKLLWLRLIHHQPSQSRLLFQLSWIITNKYPNLYVIRNLIVKNVFFFREKQHFLATVVGGDKFASVWHVFASV